MNLLQRISIKARLVWVFIVIIIIFAGFGVFTMFEMNQLGELTNTLYEHPLQVTNAALRASLGVVKMHRSMKDVSLSKTEYDLERAVQAVDEEEKIVYRQLDIIKYRILGEEGKELEKEAREQFSAWRKIRAKVIDLVLKGRNEEAAIITKGEGADHVYMLEQKMLELRAYAVNKAEGFMADAEGAQSSVSRNTLFIILAVAIFSGALALFIIISILSPLSSLKKTMSGITETGEVKRAVPVGKNEIAEMAEDFNRLILKLENQLWLREGLNSLNQELSGDLPYDDLMEKSINFVSRYVEACTAVIYSYNSETTMCELKASFAFIERGYLSNRFSPGEGIVGQVAVEKKPILLKNIKLEEAIGVTGTASAPPRNIYAIPLVYEDTLYGVLEIASFEEFDAVKKEVIDSMGQVISASMYSVAQGSRIQKLLDESRIMNEDLQGKTDELNATNEELTSMNTELKAQSEELEAQSSELRVQKAELEKKQVQVAEADRLKSEFLSNMSHELRTPLNSVLALSQLMISRGTGKNPDQEKEYLEIIERNGRHLLSLINDILDLSKIEAGKIDLYFSGVKPARVIENIVETIGPMAEEKNLYIKTDVDYEIMIETDEDKLHQIMLNLVSNAVKFTDEGGVEIGAARSDYVVSFTIADTGIGMSEQEMEHIFDEFRQIDGSTTRKHQGTGLGLAISQKLASLIGGSIEVESKKGEGSTFSLILPEKYQGEKEDFSGEHGGVEKNVYPQRGMDRADARKIPGASRKTVLVIDDEPETRALIKDYLSGSGYKVVTASVGKEGLDLARKIKPFAITLDILMPDMDGWEVIRSLHGSKETAGIPVIIVSVSDEHAAGFALGASGFLVKPIDRETLLVEMEKLSVSRVLKNVLIVDDDAVVRESVKEFLDKKSYHVETAAGGEEALEKITEKKPDIIILDLLMPEMDGFSVLSSLRDSEELSTIPVIVITAKDLSAEERKVLKRSVQKVVKKGNLGRDGFLRKIRAELESIESGTQSPFPVKKNVILVVEDNEVAAAQIRLALEENGYPAHICKGGAEAIEFVKRQIPDAVVLDLMMPDVDGFQVLENIRSSKTTYELPVLVLTAKELGKADRERLSQNNIRQLIQKGSVNRSQLVDSLKKLLKKQPGPDKKDPEGIVRASPGRIKTGTKPGDKTILVVEDNPDNLLTVTAILDEYGYEYSTAGDGLEAVKAVKEAPPGMILMDIQLPVMSGFDATREIKSDPKFKHIPVIGLTARAMVGEHVEVLKAGCDDYLPKPFSPDDLIEMIRKWIG